MRGVHYWRFDCTKFILFLYAIVVCISLYMFCSSFLIEILGLSLHIITLLSFNGIKIDLYYDILITKPNCYKQDDFPKFLA